MDTKRMKNRIWKRRGVALLLCVFALLLVTGIALAMLSMADTETSINANYRESQKAYFAALGGIQEARVRLLTDNTILPDRMPTESNVGGVFYILNSNGSDSVQPWVKTNNFYDDEICHESYTSLTTASADGNAGTLNVPCSYTPPANGWYTTRTSTDPNTGTAAALDYKWVRITWKENRSAGHSNFYVQNPSATPSPNSTPICWDGITQFPKPSDMTSCTDHTTLPSRYYENVFRVASMARTTTGARRMVIAEVAKTPPLITNAAVSSKDNVVLNGNLTVNGFDYCSCDTSSCTLTTLSDGTKTGTCASRSGKTCDASKYAIFAKGTVDDPQGKSETVEAGPNPPVVEQSSNWNYDIPSLINLYKQNSISVAGPPYNWDCSSGCGTHSGANYGTPPAFPPSPVDNPLPDSTYGSCNTSTTPWTGTGCPSNQVTYVPGDLQMTGGSIGNGILIVDGDLDIHGGLQFYGLILVRGVVKFTGGGSDSTNIFGAVLAGEESKVDNTLGGSAVINYNMCALKQNQTPQPPSLLSIREATY